MKTALLGDAEACVIALRNSGTSKHPPAHGARTFEVDAARLRQCELIGSRFEVHVACRTLPRQSRFRAFAHTAAGNLHLIQCAWPLIPGPTLLPCRSCVGSHQGTPHCGPPWGGWPVWPGAHSRWGTRGDPWGDQAGYSPTLHQCAKWACLPHSRPHRAPCPGHSVCWCTSLSACSTSVTAFDLQLCHRYVLVPAASWALNNLKAVGGRMPISTHYSNYVHSHYSLCTP